MYSALSSLNLTLFTVWALTLDSQKQHTANAVDTINFFISISFVCRANYKQKIVLKIISY